MANAGHRGSRWRSLVDQVKAEESHCWLCHHPLDPDRRWPDVWSTTVDYVIPFADGGPMERGNLHAAHLRCNTSRGRRPASNAPRVPAVHARDW